MRSILGYIVQSIAMFVFGVAGFFVLLFAIACVLVLLGIAAVCGLCLMWAGVHFIIYLSGQDNQAGHRALQALMASAGCFGVVVLSWSFVFDLFRLARRGRQPSLIPN